MIALDRHTARLRAKMLLGLGQAYVRRPTSTDPGVNSGTALALATDQYEAVETEVRAAVFERIARVFDDHDGRTATIIRALADADRVSPDATAAQP